ncbi:MAG: L,D-transpeptidase [Candidatus Berkelbacteria bacterium]|nr:L,D-transpeptidase [Candidatus Berkelbacteria bacterium]
MKKIIGYVGLAVIFLAAGFYLFYFYLPGMSEPEGLSLEVKTRREVQKELGYIPIVSPTQTVFLPEGQNEETLETEREKEALSLQSTLDKEAEAAKKVRRTSAYRYGAQPIPGNFQNMASKVIELNLSSQVITRWENGNKLDEAQISSGKRGMATPVGLFRIRNKIDMAYSRKYRLYMPYWMAFTSSGHGLHELPVFRNGVREGQNHLGRPVSHGCVRMGIGYAEQVYNWAEVGTPVVIHN